MKEKNKKGGLRRDRLPPYPAGAVSPVAQRYNRCWSFDLSVCWCYMLWPRFVLCASVPSKTGRTGAWICVERGFRWYGGHYPIAVEIWMPSRWNDRGHVGSGSGSRAPIDCARSRLSHQQEWVPRLGAPRAPRLARGLHASLGQGGKMPRRSDALMTSWGLGRDGKMPPEGPILPETFRKARVGWSLLFVLQATGMLSASLACRFY
jgi:hypothetical protein